MAAQVAHGRSPWQVALGQRPAGVGQDDLAAMGRPGDAGRPIDVEPDVVVAARDALAAVEPHPHADSDALGPGGRGQRALRLDRRGDGRGSVSKDDQEGVALGAPLGAVVRGEGHPQQAMVLLE